MAVEKIKTLVSAVDASNDIVSGVLDIGEQRSYAIQALFSGSNVAGTIKLEVSVDGTNFVDLASSSQSISSSADFMWNVNEASYRYVRVDWTATSGTGNLTVKAIIKENLTKGA